MSLAVRRLLTIGHSYVIASNRRLAHEMAVQGRGRWEVTAVAPERLAGDLREVTLEPIAGEACAVEALRMRIGSIPHLRHYERRVRSVLRGSWDVVHVWEEPYVAACAQIASAAPIGARLVPATFQNIVKRYPLPFRYFEGQVMRRANAWIAFGHTVSEVQRTKPEYAARLSRVISPGVDLQRFRHDPQARVAVRERLGWTDDIPVVGFLGRFVPEKGLATLMRALEHVKGQWRALFIGGGPLLNDLKTFAATRSDRVTVLTDVVHDDVPQHLNAMDVLCAPSETTSRWREQFGRMLIEAMACGVPVVGSQSGEIPQVLADAGILVEERNQPQWTAAIERLVGDLTLRRELAARGLARVQERFALPVVARAHLQFFEELL
jgi:glycosyltransferase involved in cell wall biosynthesis